MNITDLFLTLVKTDSPSGMEKNMSDLLQKWLVKNGFVIQVDKTGNIYATNKKEGIPLLLCAHMDTVQPGKHIKPQIFNGLIQSDKTTILGADNKAATAAIMTAVEHKMNRHLEIVFSVNEETGGGIEYLPMKWIQSKQALVFDSAKELGGIVLRSPYITNFSVSIQGKAAHTSTPGLGINAIAPAVASLYTIPVGLLDNGETTVNIGKIVGGVGINTIPDCLMIGGEVRSYSKEYFQARTANIHKIFENECKKVGTSLQFNTYGYCPGYMHTKEDSIIEKISKIYGQLDLKTIYYTHSGVSDANILNSHGIKTINLTDGTKNPHTVDEEIAVKDLEKLSQIVVSCINKL